MPSLKIAGLVGVTLGLVLLVAAIGYSVFAAVSRSRSGEYEASLPISERLADWKATDVTSADASSNSTYDTSTGGLLNQFGSLVNLYPGSSVNPKYWNEPAWAGSEPFKAPVLPEGYEAVNRPGFGLSPGVSSTPVRIRIPDIRLNETVEGLELLLEESGARYENPDRIVGHIPGTANPGENGTGWYFGHLSDFGTNEGAVFRRLPEIFDLFKQDAVYVYIDTADASYAYRVYEIRVVPREDLALTTTTTATVTMVASWPPLVFDQRFLVTAELVGIKRSP